MTTDTINEQGALIMMHPIAIADEQIYNDSLAIIHANETTRDAAAFQNYLKAHQDDFGLEPIHTNENPILVDANHMAFVWQDTAEAGDPDYMMAVIMEITPRGDGTFRKIPCAVIVGDEFQGMFAYRCPCCGTNQSGFSMLFLLKNDEGKTVFTTRDTIDTKSGKMKLFESVPDGIRVNSHQISHILQHHFNPQHACGQDHSLLPPSIDRQKLGLK